MPLTSSAKKALRQSLRKQTNNYRIRLAVKKVVDTLRKGSNKAEDLSALYSTLDTAAKRGVIHTNKVDRLKSRLNKLVKGRRSEPVQAVKTAKTVKQAIKKTKKSA
ncbi:hypothetical protein A3B57_01470 [Microgenomates group bacterium RIFCSPLOWO2_01_FULL_47_10]|nr:MAG: hypothetical protein A3B57_01470 [Microgenomates group bacterium RIFCSPLOWO2_01_FULL_47_10]